MVTLPAHYIVDSAEYIYKGQLQDFMVARYYSMGSFSMQHLLRREGGGAINPFPLLSHPWYA